VTISGCFTTSEDNSPFSSPPCTCSDASVFAQKETAPETAHPYRADSLRIRISNEPNSLLSLVDPEPVVRLIADGDIFESLVQVTKDNNSLAPALAVSWKEHPNLTVYTFHLDPQAYWHDGQPVTAGDVEYTFSKIFDPDSQVAIKSEFSDISKVTALDKHTVTFELDRPRPGFLISLAHVSILPAHVFGRIPLASHPAARTPIGSGPFKFSRWVSGQIIELERNPKWRGKKPLLEKITYRLVTDNQIAINLFKKGELDIVLDLPSSTVLSQPGGQLITYPLARFEAWITNTTRPVFSTPAVRLAVGMLIDRTTIRCSILRCRADLVEGPWFLEGAANPGFPPPFRFDPARAIELLETNGWIDTNKNRIRDRDGVELSFELLLPDVGRDLKRAAAVVQNDLTKAGIDMRVTTVELSTFFNRLRSRRFDASVITVANHKIFDPSPLFHSRSIPKRENFSGFSDPELDTLLDALRAEKEPEARLVLERQISFSLRSSGPAIFTFRPYGVALVRDYIRSLEIRDEAVNTRSLWIDETQKVRRKK
jgi:peptide/nickel transport system substrate-binding protein